jgi:hypothetical protein
MGKRFRSAEFGEYHPFQVSKGGVGTVMVSDAEIRGLIHYLNKAQCKGADRTVLELLEQMLELDKMNRPLWGETDEEREVAIMVAKAGRAAPNPMLEKISPGKYRQEVAITDKTYQINKELSKYRFLPRTWSTGAPKPWTVMWEVVPNSSTKTRFREGLFQLNDGIALRMILDFARAGYLTRLRRCLRCRNWLYAKFKHQDFCSTKCQQKHYAMSPERKEKRRDYMRGYRQRTM